jgi:hypothetical protein
MNHKKKHRKKKILRSSALCVEWGNMDAGPLLKIGNDTFKDNVVSF